MPQPAYMWLKDDTGADIKGGVTIDDDRNGSVEILAFDHEVRTPTDRDTGKVTGTRKHEPLKIVKGYDCASPYLYKAVCEGQTLKEVTIRWYQITPEGSEINYFTHILEDVKICSVKPIMHNVKDVAKERYYHMEEVSLRYKKITWKYEEGSLEASDSWTEGR
jgi:type VI secretion system secreted protein Hcp